MRRFDFRLFPAWLALVLLALVPACAGKGGYLVDTPEVMQPAELAAQLGSPDLLVIDVRRESDFAYSDTKIPGAVHHDPSQTDDWAAVVPRGRRVVLYCACPSEISSARAAQTLVNEGYKDVWVLKGGWDAWKSGGYPLENK